MKQQGSELVAICAFLIAGTMSTYWMAATILPLKLFFGMLASLMAATGLIVLNRN